MFSNSWFIKEKPLQGLFGSGGGLAVAGAGGDTPITATGGTKSPTARTGYITHTFDEGTTDNFVVSSGSGDIELFIVAGGGAGGGSASGNSCGGGGGAGALYFNNAYPVSPGTYPITIGEGGPAGPGGPTNYTGENGGN